MFKDISIMHYHFTSWSLQLQSLQPRCPWGYFCCSKSKLQYFWDWTLRPLLGYSWSLEVQHYRWPFAYTLLFLFIRESHKLQGTLSPLRVQRSKNWVKERMHRWKELGEDSPWQGNDGRIREGKQSHWPIFEIMYIYHKIRKYFGRLKHTKMSVFWHLKISPSIISFRQ